MTPVDLERAGDDELLAGAAAGEPTAFAALFRRRRGDVYRFALHMTGSPSAADDITQDVFLAAMRDGARYDRARATVAAWLCGIARNYARRRTARDRLLAPLPDGEGGQAGMPVVRADPSEDIARAQRIDAIRQAVLRLPFKYREAVVLCDLQEMSYADAAAGLGCAVGTVRSRLHRGRALLAERLSASDGTAPCRRHGFTCFA